MMTVCISIGAARDVADFLARTIPENAPLPDTAAWESVMDALYALTNDTDAIVTDRTVEAAITALPDIL